MANLYRFLWITWLVSEGDSLSLGHQVYVQYSGGQMKQL